MSFSSENGYLPSTISAIMSDIRNRVNAQFGTSYTAESFVGTNFYKYFYTLAQRLQENEVKTSEIFTLLQQYFAITNERIQRPVATAPGLIEALENEGYVASVKRPLEADAGKIFVCVQVDGYEFSTVTIGDLTFTAIEPGVEGNSISITLEDTGSAGSEVVTVVGSAISVSMDAGVSTATQIKTAIDGDADAAALVSIVIASGQEAVAQAAASLTNLADGSGTGYPAKKLKIGTLIKDSIAGGIVSQGDQVENIVLSNGQDFDFKYSLPNRTEVLLRLTTTLSDNNQVLILSPEEVKEILMDNIAEKYRLGMDFEPDKYFTTDDAPWTSAVLLEWSDDNGGNWYSTIFDAAFDDLFVINLENITVVEN